MTAVSVSNLTRAEPALQYPVGKWSLTIRRASSASECFTSILSSDGATLDERYFKAKDRVENYLAGEVKAGRRSLDDAQRGIASDWTQYLTTADRN